MEFTVKKISVASGDLAFSGEREQTWEQGPENRRPRNAERLDRLELSRQALAAYQERSSQNGAGKAPLLAALESCGDDADAAMESVKALMRCIRIAAHILNGDNVPAKDQKYLMDHAPDLYKMAVSMRKVKENPEDCDSELEDEEDGSRPEREAASAGAEALPAPEADSADA